MNMGPTNIIDLPRYVTRPNKFLYIYLFHIKAQVYPNENLIKYMIVQSNLKQFSVKSIIPVITTEDSMKISDFLSGIECLIPQSVILKFGTLT